MSLFEKLPFKKMAEKIPEEKRTKVPILGKAIPFANQIICGLIVLVVVVVIIVVAVRGSRSGGGSGQVQLAGISDNGEPVVVHKSGPGGDYFYELRSVIDGTFTEYEEDGIIIYWYTGSGGAVNIPAKIENIQVVRIAENTFKGNTSITSVVIPDGVKVIDDSAFEDCSGLKSVTIPASVKTIGTSTFDSCTSLTSVTIPSSVTSIGAWAFFGCTGLTSVTLPDTIQEIGAGAFRQCENLHTINIPAEIKTIGDSAFRECVELYNLTIPNSITAITTWGTRNDLQFYGSGKLPLATRQRLSQLGYDRKSF